MALSPELHAWLVPGLAGMVASVDASGQPQLARIWAARVRGAGDTLELYVQRSASSALAEAVLKNGRAAANLIEVSTYRSRLFKGPCAVLTDGADDVFLEEYLTALERAFASVGMPPGSAEQLLSHADAPRSMLVLTLSVESIFDQSPKPGAGAPL